jgi:D-alanyl-D-alanine endopeptidase (penicillin-binding protein 7)
MITIRKQDRDLHKLTGSRLRYGKASLSRRELLLVALLASENAAAAALGRTTFAGGSAEFVRAMNRKAAELGMDHSRFVDPTGLYAENRASPRDLVKLTRAAYEYPLIRQASTTRSLEVRPYQRRGPLVYRNTNRLLKNDAWNIELSKTGYIEEAGRCLVMRAEVSGHDLYIVLLNSFGKLTPFGDSNRLRKWLQAELELAQG